MGHRSYFQEVFLTQQSSAQVDKSRIPYGAVSAAVRFWSVGHVFRFVPEQNRDDGDQSGGYCSDTDDNGCRDDVDRVYCRCDIHQGNESQTLGLQP